MPVTSSLEITPLDLETNKQILKSFKGERSGWCQVGPKKCILTKKYAQEMAELINNFRSRPDDVWIVTFPRSGTTLTQEMIWLIATNFDFEGAKNKLLADRFPFFEFSSLLHDETMKEIIDENSYDPQKQQILCDLMKPQYKILDEMPSPRFIKTHLPLSLIPQDVWTSGAKVIYVARNPKDVAVSYYYLCRLWRTFDFVDGFDQFWKYFQKDQLVWTPYWTHILEGWEKKDDRNILFMFYEEIIKDLPKAIKYMANFLGHMAMEGQIAALADHLDVKNFKNNPSVNFEFLKDVGILQDKGESFIRTGKVGETSIFSSELQEEANKWIEENYKKTDMRFPCL